MTTWAHRDDPASLVKRRLEGVAIYSQIATNEQLKREDDGDEHDLAAKKYFDMRNDAMREIHQLVDQLAADAAAAPAVGVTVDEAEQLVDELLAMYRRTGYGFTKRRVFTAFEKQRANVIALLTAQPEPGTHDDAGQPATEGGVTG